MRRPLPWLLALPLMAAGSFAAHASSALFGWGRLGAEPGRELAERSSTGVASQTVIVLGIVGALVLLAGANRLARLLGGRPARGASPAQFFWLPPLAFGLQEISERLLRAEVAPFQAALEPRFLFGLALQVPFGLAALILAWLLLRVARRVIRALSRAPRPLLRGGASTPAPASWIPPRIPAPALGYAQRGPPGA